MQPALILQSISFKLNDNATQLTPHCVYTTDRRERKGRNTCM